MNALILRQRVMTGMILLVTIFAAIFPASAQAESTAPDDQWKFSITPYLWLPNINGTLKYNIPPGSGGSPEVETGPNNYLQNLQTVILVSGEVRKDRWLAFTDIIYLDFANQKSNVKAVNFGGDFVSSSVNLVTSSSLKAGVGMLGAGYAVQAGQAVSLDIFGGVRYAGLDASTDWQLAVVVTGPLSGHTFPRVGSISGRADLWDGIIGVKGRILLGSSNWSVPYYLDAGTGSSQVTWQGMVGVAYMWNWGGLTLAYRNLYYDQKDDKLVQNLRFTGPALGVTFRF